MRLFTIISFLFFLTISYCSYSQCNEELINTCAMLGGDEVIYINSFKARLKKTKKNKPPNNIRYSVVLNKNVTYRFKICNAEEFDGRGILRLCDRNSVLGSTFNKTKNKEYTHFDFLCSKTSVYSIYIFFMDGKEGCAVGTLSLVNRKR